MTSFTGTGNSLAGDVGLGSRLFLKEIGKVYGNHSAYGTSVPYEFSNGVHSQPQES